MNEVTAIAVFTAGVISFLSPCVLPLVPSYLSFIGGTGLGGSGTATRSRIIIHTFFFVAGFSVVFTALGAAAAAGGRLLMAYAPVYELIAGLVIILLGLNLVFGFIPALYREARYHVRRSPAGPLGALFVGMAFGAGWTPCIGPILASVLLLASADGELVSGVGYLLLYSVGLGLPFILTGLFLGRATRFQQFLRRNTARIQVVGGALLTAMGLLIATGRFQLFTAWLLSAGDQLLNNADQLPGWAGRIAEWLGRYLQFQGI